MALFSNNKGKTPLLGVNNNGVSLITEGTIIKGKIKAQSEIHIQGVFEGDIDSQSTIVIDSSGKSKGNMKANRMVINGLFEGESKCTNIEILSEGKYRGDIYADDLVIEKGGSFHGTSHPKEN